MHNVGGAKKISPRHVNTQNLNAKAATAPAAAHQRGRHNANYNPVRRRKPYAKALWQHYGRSAIPGPHRALFRAGVAPAGNPPHSEPTATTSCGALSYAPQHI